MREVSPTMNRSALDPVYQVSSRQEFASGIIITARKGCPHQVGQQVSAGDLSPRQLWGTQAKGVRISESQAT